MPIYKLGSLRYASRWTKVPNQVLDELTPGLRDTELRVLLVMVRSTLGWNRPDKPMVLTYAALQARTGRSSEAVSRALRELERRGLIHRMSGRGNKNPKMGHPKIEGQQ